MARPQGNPTPAPLPPVVHHTGLEWTGGATRVARLLAGGMAASGVAARLTCEVSESGIHQKESSLASSVIAPDRFGLQLAPDETAHVHCTGHWTGLLGSIPQGSRVVMTLHDCELFTGGCPYPLDCPVLDQGCVDPCPRAFPESGRVRRRKHQLLHDLNPALAAPSRWLARLARTHLHRPVTVIPNGIPWPERPLPRREARARLGLLPSARVAVFAAHGGLGAAYKSGGDWRALWQAVKARVPESLCFAVGGDTADREGDLVIWPYVERERLALLMAAADTLLYPTLADNHSLVILEAMAQGLPVVAYGAGGVPEQISHEATGLLVEPCRPDSFVSAAVALLADPARCREMGTNAFVSGHRRFAASRMVADYLKLYRQHPGTISDTQGE